MAKMQCIYSLKTKGKKGKNIPLSFGDIVKYLWLKWHNATLKSSRKEAGERERKTKLVKW